MLGVPRLRGLHQRGGFGGGDVDSLAVEHRARSRVRATDHDHWNAGAVEPRQVGDAGDPKDVLVRQDAGDRLIGGQGAGRPRQLMVVPPAARSVPLLGARLAAAADPMTGQA